MSSIAFLRTKLMMILEEEEEWEKRGRHDYYLGRMSYEVYLLRHVVLNMWAKHPTAPEQTYQDFMIDFKAIMKKGRNKPPPKVVEGVQEDEEDDFGWEGETLEVEETEEERQKRYEYANLMAHARWSAFLGVSLTAVGADKYVKGPDEIEAASEQNGT